MHTFELMFDGIQDLVSIAQTRSQRPKNPTSYQTKQKEN